MWNLMMQPMMRWYYRRSYEPETLLADDFSPIPEVYRLCTVPWIASCTPVCQSTALQMIAGHYGLNQPRRYFDFLMGFTYGASDMPGVGFFPVGVDPEKGLKEAAPYLGLRCRYLVTDDQDLYLQALHHFLALEFPLRVPLDMGILYGVQESIPHNEVLIGYDSRGFEYYEPVCRAPANCRPVHMQPGEIGLYVPNERLLKAVEKESTLFKYPWRYILTYLEPGPRATDLKPIWQRNGKALIGGTNFGTHYGATATLHLADQLEKEASLVDLEKLELSFEIAAHVRCENAAFMHEMNGHDSRLQTAATCFEQAARCFEESLSILQHSFTGIAQTHHLASQLRAAAAAEETAGHIFLDLAAA